MRRWVLRGPKDLQIEEVADPDPGPTEVLIDLTLSAISLGSELHAYRSGPTGMMTNPGYLAVGSVRGVGRDVTEFGIGDRVVARVPHGTSAATDVSRVLHVPPGVSDENGVFSYIGTLGHHCLHAAGYRGGDNVAVVGLGVVGACAALVAESVGARTQLIDVAPERLELARSLGFRVFDASSDDLADEVVADLAAGPDVIIDASASWSGLLTAARIARQDSAIAVIGINRDTPSPAVGARLFNELLQWPAKFHYQGIRIIGCSNHPSRAKQPTARWTVEAAQEYLMDATAAGRLDLSRLISERIPPSGLPEVMARADAGDLSMLGVVIDWSRD